MGAIKRIVLTLLALVAAYLVFVLIHNLIFGVATRTAPVVYEKARAAQTLAKDWASEPLPMETIAPPSASTVTSVKSAFPPSLHGHRESAGAPEDAVAAALEFASAIGSGDPAAYVAWRESRGFAFLGRFPLGHVGEPMDDVLNYAWRLYRKMPGELAGETPTTELAPREAFDTLFTAFAMQDGGSLRPIGVAVAPGAAEAHYKRITHADDHMRYVPFAEDGLGHPFWVGGIGIMLRPWFSYERTMEELIEAHEGVWLARVHLALRGARGHTIPNRVTLFYDPASGWRVREWAIANIGLEARVTEGVLFGAY
jgi:hypothetical protein